MKNGIIAACFAYIFNEAFIGLKGREILLRVTHLISTSNLPNARAYPAYTFFFNGKSFFSISLGFDGPYFSHFSPGVVNIFSMIQ